MVKNPLLISGIFLLLSLILGVALVWPKYQDWWELRGKIQAKEKEFASMKEYFSNLQKNSQELKNYQIQLQKIDFALPKKLSLPEIFNFIQKTSSQTGLLLKGISPTQPTLIEGTEIQETKITLNLNGNYSSFKNFLSLLENSARFFEIETISLSSAKEGLDFDLIMKVYSY